MLHHKLLQPEGILILEPDSALDATDFENLARELDPYIAEHEKLSGLMIHATRFPGWKNIDAFLTHLRFVEHHIQHVRKVAFVSDSGFLTEAPKIAAHLVQAEVRHFPESEYDGALRWLKAADA